MIAEYEIELHHFENQSFPKEKRIDADINIVQIKEEGELLIEMGTGKDKGKVCIGAGGLSLRIKVDDFMKQIEGLKDRLK